MTIKVAYYAFQNNTLVPLEDNISLEEWPGQAAWIDIRADNDAEVADFLGAYGFSGELQERILNSGNHNQPLRLGESVILEIILSSEEDIYISSTMTLILKKSFCVSVVPFASTLMDETRTLIAEEADFSFSPTMFVQIITAQIMARGYRNMNLEKSRLNDIVKTLDSSPEGLSPADVTSCKRRTGQLADIIEDQFTGFGFVKSLLWEEKHNNKDMDAFKNLVSGFEPLNKAMIRLEEKAGAIHDQYMLIQQERSTRRINLLTIIQAVFVPLTFVAGVYGMNFESMPELKWVYGYPAVWGLFLGIAVLLMIFFYRKGWFE